MGCRGRGAYRRERRFFRRRNIEHPSPGAAPRRLTHHKRRDRAPAAEAARRCPQTQAIMLMQVKKAGTSVTWYAQPS
jgi:hypothetical protein